jgi:hypothetical protein
MARMSELLEEALTLDEAARRAWLTSLPLEHQDLAAALREALLPGAAQAADLKALMSLPKLDAAEEASATSWPVSSIPISRVSTMPVSTRKACPTWRWSTCRVRR